MLEAFNPNRAVLDYLVAAADRLSDPASFAEVIQETNQQLFKLMSEYEEAIGWVRRSLGQL